MNTRVSIAWLAGAASLSLVTLVLANLPSPNPESTDGLGALFAFGRSLIIIAFFLLGPGLALVPLLRLQHLLIEWSLVVALSVAVDILVVLAILYAWHLAPWLAVNLLVAISLLGAAAQVGILLPRLAQERRVHGPAWPVGM